MAMLNQGASGLPESPIAAVVARMQQHQEVLPERLSHQRVFLSTYLSTTKAVGAAVEMASRLAVISDNDFADSLLMDRRRRDHERIDRILASRVAAEDNELTATGGATLVDRLLTPLNRQGSKGFLRRPARRSGTTRSRSRKREPPDRSSKPSGSRSSSC